MQCWHATGYCWCVDSEGHPIEGTTMRGRPDCQRGRGIKGSFLTCVVLVRLLWMTPDGFFPPLTLAAFPRRMMVAPRLMQKTYDMDGERFRLVCLFLMIFHLRDFSLASSSSWSLCCLLFSSLFPDEKQKWSKSWRKISSSNLCKWQTSCRTSIINASIPDELVLRGISWF